MKPNGGPRYALSLALAAALLGAGAAPVSAQTVGRVQGEVVDAATLRPLAGAQVYVPGTEIGTVTNSAGRYLLLNVPAGQAVVRVQMIGYGQAEQTVAVAYGQLATADFELRQSAIALDELVITGQGRATERRKLATSVDVVNAQEIEAAPVTSIDQLLQGRVTGATVAATSAQPGTAGLISFRGVSSVYGSTTPVIYVDGVRVDNSDRVGLWTGGEYTSALADLLTSDIERVEVTKGGAASTLYGSDAASGVIQIFTKKGATGTPRVTARIEQGLDQPETRFIKDAKFVFKDLVEDGKADPDFVKNNFLKTGHFQNYYVGVTGGSAATTYNVSGRVQQGGGVQPKNGNEIYAIRGGIQAEVSEKTRIDFNGSYTRSNFERLYNGTAIADPLTTFEVGDALFFSGTESLEEALEVFLMPDINEEVSRFIFGTALSYTPNEVFNSRLSVGVDYRSNEQRIYEPIGFVPGTIEGRLDRFNRNYNSVTLDYVGSISYPQQGTVTSTFTFGAQGFREDDSRIDAHGERFGLPGAPDFDEAADITAFEGRSQIFNGGLLFQERLGLYDRLFLGAGVRLDYNSAFGDDFGLQTYPKIEASYVLSDESFFQDAVGNLVGSLKLRGAYGKTGKFPGPFLKDRTFSSVSFRGESAPRFDNPGNDDLGPEVVATYEVGVDASLLDERVALDVTYYTAKTRDALFFVPEQPATGQGVQLRNIGEIRNQGYEIGVNLRLLSTESVLWSARVGYQAVDNEVTDMGGAAPFFVDGSQQRVAEGKPIGAWYVTTPFDSNGDGKLDASERRYTGSQPTPKKSGNISTDVTLFNRLSLSAMADWATDFQVMDWGSVWATFNAIYRIEDYPVRYSTAGDSIGPFGQSQARQAFILDGDYLKLREISARYSVPSDLSQRFGLDRASVFASVRNVWVWSRQDLVDPELNGVHSEGNLNLGGATSITLSPPRQFRAGLEITF